LLVERVTLLIGLFIVVDRKIAQVFLDFLFFPDKIALGEDCNRRELQSDLNRQCPILESNVLKHARKELALLEDEVDVHHVHRHQGKT